MTKPTLIAIVEDEEHLAQGLIFNLEAESYRTHHEADGDAALAWLLDATSPTSQDPPAAILLDVMLPGRDGFSIVSELRKAGRYTPVLLLTARGRAEDIVEGFAAGADDYLPKPFDLGVLFARLTALLRRMQWQTPTETPSTHPAASTPTPAFTLAGRTIDLDALEIRLRILNLSPTRPSISPSWRPTSSAISSTTPARSFPAPSCWRTSGT